MAGEIEPPRRGVAVPRDERGRILKGYTPNPSGRRKGVAGVARMILDRTRDGADMVEFAERIWLNRVAVVDERGAEQVDEDGHPLYARGNYSDEQRWQAFQWLSDRGLGRPVVAVDMQAMVATVDAGEALGAVYDPALLSPDDVLALDALLRRALPARAPVEPELEDEAIDVPAEGG